MDLYNKARFEEHVLTEEINHLEEQLSRLPEGSLVIHRNGQNGGYCKWYLREYDVNERKYKRKYLPKSRRDYAVKLAERSVLTRRLKEAEHKRAAVQRFLSLYPNPENNRADRLLTESPGYRELLPPKLIAGDRALSEWENYPYEVNPYKPEMRKIKTLRGDLVRSRAEALIANVLLQHGIAYRYDCIFRLGNAIIYPDFIVVRPGAAVPDPAHQLCETDINRILLIEHNGRMDDPDYLMRYKHKTALYCDYGFIPSINMIMTYETKNDPFDISYFVQELDYFFK